MVVLVLAILAAVGAWTRDARAQASSAAGPGGGTEIHLVDAVQHPVRLGSEPGRLAPGAAGSQLLSAGELRRMLAAPDPRPLLIDVRRQEEFVAGRISGALNLPLSQIKTKGFLRNRPFVLMDGGSDGGGLAAESGRLAAAGFTAVRVLEGGLAAWQLAGGGVIGETPADSSWAFLSPAQASQVLGGSDWRVVDAGSERSGAVPARFTNSVHVPFGGSGLAFLQALDRTRAQSQTFERVLVTEISRPDFQQILKAAEARREGGRCYFQLEGGAKAYGEYFAQQNRIQNRRTATLADQGLSGREHHFESSAPGRSCCGGK